MSTDIRKELEKKKRYYNQQYENSVVKWVEGKLCRTDRDMAIRCRERVKTYTEIMELMDKQG